MQDFVKLRDDAAQKGRGHPARPASVKCDAREACKLFNAFSAAEAKMVKYRHRQCSLVRHSPERRSTP